VRYRRSKIKRVPKKRERVRKEEGKRTYGDRAREKKEEEEEVKKVIVVVVVVTAAAAVTAEVVCERGEKEKHVS